MLIAGWRRSGGGAPGSTRQWYSSGKAALRPARTQLVVMTLAASSRHAPKPGPPTSTSPYWQNGGTPNRFAVDITLPAERSRSVSGMRLAKTGTPATSSSTEVPPIPEPRVRACSSDSASCRSLRNVRALATSPYLLTRSARDMSNASGGFDTRHPS
ncbi:hypothetical protein ACSDR0_35445 [Streptosporangium sp. G11]|uniref:hypothetical protein n=1 Tax=Streptosporangium sp. G11 TaxID=3436926 RepID=UPI003EB70A9A